MRYALILTLLAGCGSAMPDLPTTTRCHFDFFGEVAGETVFDCDVFRENISIAYEAMARAGVNRSFNVPVIVRDSDDLSPGPEKITTGYAYFCGDEQWIELTRSSSALAHELTHIAFPEITDKHEGWTERGFTDTDLFYWRHYHPLNADADPFAGPSTSPGAD